MANPEFIKINQEETQEPKKTIKNHNYPSKIILLIYNWTSFILCIFSIYLIITIENSIIKYIMMFVMANYITSFILLIYFEIKNGLNKMYK